MSKRPDLVLLEGEKEVRRFTFGETALRLGRSSSNDIHFTDEGLSRNHCLFEPTGDTGVRITDLASGNGTFVNGVQLGKESVELKEGDLIEVGSTILRFGEMQKPRAKSVDLGLERTAGDQTDAGANGAKRPIGLRLLWMVLIILVLGAIVSIICVPNGDVEPATNEISLAANPVLVEFSYEKVLATKDGIFRYALNLSPEGMLSVKIDDTANNRRMPAKSKLLSEEARAELNSILSPTVLNGIDDEYTGVMTEPPALDAYHLKVLYSSRVRDIRISNMSEPEAFSTIREKLEAFSKSELGVWAIAYSRERLIELAENATRVGMSKWEDRDVKYGNLAAAIASFEEALFYLETVNPKPACAEEARKMLETTNKELDYRYNEQRFVADRALNLSQWDAACEALKILLEMVPNRQDDRHRDAQRKLISAEKNQKKTGGR